MDILRKWLTKSERNELLLRADQLANEWKCAKAKANVKGNCIRDRKFRLGVISVGDPEHIFSLYVATVDGKESFVLVPAAEEEDFLRMG